MPGSAAPRSARTVDFSLTTNATLLKPDIIEFLADNRVGVTISIDGPKEVQDKFRVFHNGAGSYDVVAPKIKELLKRHRSRPIGARVTLTSGQMDIKRIYRHLTEEMGFWEVGFAPVTTSPTRGHAISDAGYGAHAWDSSGTSRMSSWRRRSPTSIHGFSNVKETLEELHKGVSKAFPCGAGLGLLGVADRRRRRALSPLRRIRRAQARHRAGRNRSSGAADVSRDSITSRTRPTAARCWARPLCSGGCYHEAHTRYGDTTRVRTCTTANGFAAGPTCACRSTASSPSATRRSSRSSTMNPRRSRCQ